MSATIEIDGQNSDEKTSNDNIVHDRNPFGLSDNTFGAGLMVCCALVQSVVATMTDFMISEGVSANCLNFGLHVATIIGTIILDLCLYYSNYYPVCDMCTFSLLFFCFLKTNKATTHTVVGTERYVGSKTSWQNDAN